MKESSWGGRNDRIRLTGFFPTPTYKLSMMICLTAPVVLQQFQKECFFSLQQTFPIAWKCPVNEVWSFFLDLFIFPWQLAIAIFHFVSYFLCCVIWALYTVLIHAIIIILLDCIIFKGVSFSIHLLEADYPGDNPHITDGAALIPLTEQWGEHLIHRLQSLVKPWSH